MLVKTTDAVFVPAVPAVPYRPYSKTCPPPVPPTSGGTKKVCGTITVSVFVAFSKPGVPINVAQSVVSLPGYPPIVSYTSDWDHDLPTTAPQQVSQIPYCTTVRTP